MSKHDIPLVGPILNYFLGSRNDRFVKKYTQRVEAINALEPQARALTDAQIREHIHSLRERIDAGTPADDLLVESFAIAREAMDRAVGIRNIFNPATQFDPARLSAQGQQHYAAVKAQIEATPEAAPEGPFRGCSAPVPGWRQVDIPAELYEEVRGLYPESRPPFRARPFDVQLIGAMVLYQGRIAEMKTGEGKTIVAPLACYLACAQRVRVHVVTVNDYLVQRDRDWTFPFFHALGLTVGAIHPQHMQPEDTKRQMYRCDVVYGTTSEFGFDYLRDNMKRTADSQVQKRREFAIVDEVDSILIDEARTPLIISGQAHDHRPRYELADQLARHLVQKQQPWQDAEDKHEACRRLIKGLEGDIRNAADRAKVPELQQRLAAARADLPRLLAERNRFTQYFETHPERKQVHLTHAGIAEAQRVAGVGSFYVGDNTDLPHLLEQALRAHAVYQRDRDYVVADSPNPNTGQREPSIVIVDANTGRPMVGRQWSDGLHQACETKEAVPIRDETQTVATVTIQNFFKMYQRLAGMTGTADTEAQEFYDIYKLDVVAIPTNRPVSRSDRNDLVFISQKDKWEAILDEIKAFHDAGRPVLVGTTSVDKSETLSRLLSARHQIRHEVLNAKQHEREAHIIESAGQLGAVMIATNMAGRGTDIKLGPLSRAALLDHWLRRGLCPREIAPDWTDEQLRQAAYRKIAPAELEAPRRETDELPFADLELRLLRAWAMRWTDQDPAKIDRADPDRLRQMLDQAGRSLLHRLRWFSSIEDMGGLHVLGTERHESRRIDNQLRGRSGRQGDKGSSRFYVSMEDDLMKLFAGEAMLRLLARLGMREGVAIENPMLSRSVENAQRKVEETNFQRRKTILEYDEVMEHQRRSFYGLRQRVLEGRDLKGLAFEFISDAVSDAVEDYLTPDYPARCAADYAKQTLDVAISPKRLAGLAQDEMIERVRRDAVDEVADAVRMAITEFLPEPEGEHGPGTVDAQGLARWARDRFGVELNPEDLAGLSQDSRPRIEGLITDAARQRLEALDLTPVAAYLAPGYGAARFCEWAKRKFGVTLDPEAVAAAVANGGPQAAAPMVLSETQKLYRAREIEVPASMVMSSVMLLSRQDPRAAMSHLVRWANTRFGAGWTVEQLFAMGPAKSSQALRDLVRGFVESDALERQIAHATALATDDELAAHWVSRFHEPLPEELRHLRQPQRAAAIATAVENELRTELIYFERSVMLNALDDAWKSHLYAMDQLRDTIGFRAFSQQDPRIEYKREGSRIFQETNAAIRRRITDDIFRVQAVPSPKIFDYANRGLLNQDVMNAVARGAQLPSLQPRPQPYQPVRNAAAPIAPTIAGPGMDLAHRQPPAAPPRPSSPSSPDAPSS
ncbi:MAG: preprotein translocase subunit SecA [Planctomyces sp.]|nr:preprotein translocase subunit SecA [Planctomyces sp.]MBA4039769.1 preprotein translocase subunit SecA [Planctomyces sp.]